VHPKPQAITPSLARHQLFWPMHPTHTVHVRTIMHTVQLSTLATHARATYHRLQFTNARKTARTPRITGHIGDTDAKSWTCSVQ
jgi:hypothetical protein